MRLREKINPPKKYRDEIDEYIAPNSKSPPASRDRKKRLNFVPYNPNLPPAAFPTLDSVSPAVERHRTSRKKRKSTDSSESTSTKDMSSRDTVVEPQLPMNTARWEQTGAHFPRQNSRDLDLFLDSFNEPTLFERVNSPGGTAIEWSELSAGHRLQILENLETAGIALTQEQKKELDGHERRHYNELEAEARAQHALQEDVSKAMVSHRFTALDYRALFEKHFAALLHDGAEVYSTTNGHELDKARRYLQGCGQDPALAGRWKAASAGLSSSIQPVSAQDADTTQHSRTLARDSVSNRHEVHGDGMGSPGPPETPTSFSQETHSRERLDHELEQPRNERGMFTRSNRRVDRNHLRGRIRASIEALPPLDTLPLDTPEGMNLFSRSQSPSFDELPPHVSKYDHDPSTMDVAKRYYISPGNGAKVPLSSSGKTTPSDENAPPLPSRETGSTSHAEALERLRIDSLKHRPHHSLMPRQDYATPVSHNTQVTYDSARKAIGSSDDGKKRRRFSSEEEAHSLLVKFGAKHV